MITMSAETAAIIEKQKAVAVREAAPATKADVDRLFDEIRRLQDTVSALVIGGAREADDRDSF